MFNKIKKILYSRAKAVALKFAVPAAARSIAKKIRDNKDPNTLVFLSYFGIGDILYCLSMLKEIKRVNPGKKIVVVTLEKYRSIVESFDSYDKVEFITNFGGVIPFFGFSSRALRHTLFTQENCSMMGSSLNLSVF